ncbi:MAG: DUF4124 domain-containing protein [Zoogloeaceae bacterium]|nr:DUF4124 domain-containing protein [Zoogloeaceae bacterium]
MTRKKILLPVACSLLSLLWGMAWGGEVYRCVDGNGHTTYSSVDLGKDCKLMEIDAGTSMPPPAVSKSPSTGITKEQKANRIRHLEQQLSNERQKLEAAKTALSEQENIRLGNERNYQKVLERLQPYQEAVAEHERNIGDLNRELSGLR